MKRKPKAVTDQARKGLQAFIALRRVHVKALEFASVVVHDVKEGTRAVVVNLGGAKWGVYVPRLHEIEAALFRDEPIDAGLRQELRAIVAVLGYECEKRLASPSNRRPSPELLLRAAVVLALHKSHGIKVEAALNAVCGHEDEHRKDRQNVERAYQKLSKKGGRVSVRESEVNAALDRLKEPHNPK